MSPPGIGGPPFFLSSGASAITASVVSNRLAIDAAFCKRGTRDFGRVNDTGLYHVAVLFSRGVEAIVRVLLSAHLLYHDRAFMAGVVHDLPKRLFQRATNYLHADAFVFVLERQSYRELFARV